MIGKQFRIGVGLLALTAGCASMAPQAASDKSLYERLGGKQAIVVVVDDFVGRVAADDRINKFFAKADVPRLKTRLVDQICEASADMKTAHRGMGITNAAFDALVGDLVATLDKFKVGEREKSELLGALGPMKKDIVEKP